MTKPSGSTKATAKVCLVVLMQISKDGWHVKQFEDGSINLLQRQFGARTFVTVKVYD